MARHRASRPNPAKVVGALLIALALLIGISIVPPQTARFPGLIAARLGQAVGRGLVPLPVLGLLVGLIFFVRESLRLSPRVYGLLAGYLAGLSILHLRYPAGGEFAAAAAREGGGYVGAVITSSLRRWVGEPGLWLVTAVGVLAAALLLVNRSLTEVLRAAARGARGLGAPLAAVGLRAAAAAGGAVRAAVRPVPGAIVREVRGLALLVGAWARGARASLARAKPSGRWCPPASDAAEFAAVPHDAAGSPPGGLPFDPSARGFALEAVDVSGTPARSHRLAPRLLPDLSAGRSLSEGDAVGRAPEAWPVRDPLQAEEVGSGPGEPGRAPRRKRPLAAQEPLKFPSKGYALPPLSLLDTEAASKARNGGEAPEEVARNLERTLASFGVEAKVVRWEIGPAVTRFELQPAPGVKVQRITSLQNDIALALAASSVRLEAPIPGKAAIGVELPNERPGLVHLGEILASPELQRSPSPLTVSIGKGTAGHPIVADLVAMPHLLIAGATGAGKSVALNSMIATLLFRATPEQVRFLMIDPKRVELTNYNGIPHLLSPVVTEPRETAIKLRWAIQEMESRYALFAGEGVRNIQSFNARHPDRTLAYIVIIIDELADLMMVAPKDFEEIICRLAQMTRAVGIHLVVATQRPSVDVITGLIKANIPSRIAFAVTSQVDSRTILDHPGAERLLGRGDMLFAPIGATRPMRVQGSYISDADSQRLVEFWRAQGRPEYVEELVQAGANAAAEDGERDDTLLADAAGLVVRAGYGSVSLLQRKMRIGYVRAARLVDQLEERGIVGPSQGSSPREVLVGIDDLERLFRSGHAHAATAQDAAPAEA